MSGRRAASPDRQTRSGTECRRRNDDHHRHASRHAPTAPAMRPDTRDGEDARTEQSSSSARGSRGRARGGRRGDGRRNRRQPAMSEWTESRVSSHRVNLRGRGRRRRSDDEWEGRALRSSDSSSEDPMDLSPGPAPQAYTAGAQPTGVGGEGSHPLLFGGFGHTIAPRPARLPLLSDTHTRRTDSGRLGSLGDVDVYHVAQISAPVFSNVLPVFDAHPRRLAGSRQSTAGVPPRASSILVGCDRSCLLSRLPSSEYTPSRPVSSSTSTTTTTTAVVRHSCVVCCEDFKARDKVTTLPCLHLYHTACIMPWIRKERTCPICKRSLDSKDLALTLDC